MIRACEQKLEKEQKLFCSFREHKALQSCVIEVQLSTPQDEANTKKKR